MSTAETHRKRLRIAFFANLAMFAIGIVGWIAAESTGLLADAFDMLADASAYVLAYIAIGRSMQWQRSAAYWSAGLLVLMGLGVIGEVILRWMHGSEPVGLVIVGFSLLSLIVNGSVLSMLSPYRQAEEVHLRAAWRDTRADVWVNIGVLASGAAIALTGNRYIDLVMGLAISLFVIHEGYEIWEEAHESTS